MLALNKWSRFLRLHTTEGYHIRSGPKKEISWFDPQNKSISKEKKFKRMKPREKRNQSDPCGQERETI